MASALLSTKGIFITEKLEVFSFNNNSDTGHTYTMYTVQKKK